MPNDTDEYNASKIMVLEGPQGIRKRPAMYIGSTGTGGVVHLLYEVIDNAIDEAAAGYCKHISVKLTQDNGGNVAEVVDDGRGIPIDIMPKYNKSALEIIMTTLHKGAKFNTDVYKISGGLHGVGLTVVNALSEFVEVTVNKDNKVYRQTFSRGTVTSDLMQIGETQERGTTIRFKPDAEIFPSPIFDSALIKERLRYTSYLNPGLSIKFVDDRFNQHEENVFFSENGLKDFMTFLNKENQALTQMVHIKSKEGPTTVEFVIQYVNSYDEKLDSFVNNIRTDEGGTHEAGFHSGLSRAILNYISKNKPIKSSDIKISGEDVKEGLTAIVSILMENPEFEGQTKERLGNVQIKSMVESLVYSAVSRYLEEHPQDARAIVEKVSSAAIARESARRARELARKKSGLENAVLPGKLADCIVSDPEKTEIFIVEGESAGGSSKQGRDKNIQAILPLRGKILNVEKASAEKIFDNLEIKAMITAFGTGINESFNAENVRYKKIIIMADADVDGSHIKTLLLTFLYRYMKKLIDLGYVYIAQPPLYKVWKGKNIYYCYDDNELATKQKELDGGAEIQRYKGLGEMNPDQLWETTMNPEKRLLKKVTVSDAERANKLFEILMGIDVPQRRKFLHEHAEEVGFLDV